MHDLLDPGHVYVTVDLLILTVREKRLHLLLGRRKNPPYAGRPALPGRFIGLEENAKVTAQRVLAEMLPAEDPFLEQLYTFTAVNRDPRGRVISTAYLVILPWERLAGAAAEETVILKPYRVSVRGGELLLESEDGTVLTDSDMAFDHGQIIMTGIRRLQGKIDYTDIGFRFLPDPERFSLGELQNIYEAVLETTLDSSNFRRDLMRRYEQSGRLEQTVEIARKGRGRPAALYRYRFGE